MTRQDTNGVSRRGFIKVATVTAVAAAATGGGAAFLRRGAGPVIISTDPTPVIGVADPIGGIGSVVDVIPTVAPVAPIIDQASGGDALAQLAASQAENMQLRAQLDQALRDLEAARAGEGNARGAHDALSLELDGARTQLGVLGGLVALYQQLDEADLGGVVENGLGVVGEKLGELLGGVPALSIGLEPYVERLGDVGVQPGDGARRLGQQFRQRVHHPGRLLARAKRQPAPQPGEPLGQHLQEVADAIHGLL